MSGFGLRLSRSQGMEGFTGNLNGFAIDPSNSNAIFTGDPVVLNAGAIEAASDGATAILGVFMGCRYTDSGGDVVFKNHWDGGSNRSDAVASIALPVASMFWIKGEEGVDFQPATSIGAAHPFVINAGSPQYGDSRVTLGAAGAGALVVHRLVDMPNNKWGTDGPLLEVSCNLQLGTFSDAS
ncbi:MAG: hypothetical protein GY813_09445 [Halieaceae bacterium]|nr:hypothetical protein [Halieaceae bacterium]